MTIPEQDRAHFRLPLTVSSEEYGEALRALVSAARKQPGKRTEFIQSLGKYSIYAFFLLPVLALLLYYFHWDFRIAGALTVIFFLLNYLAVGLHFRWTDAWLGFSYDVDRHGRGTASFGDVDVRLVGPFHEQVWNWSLLRKLHAAPGLYVVEFAGMEILIIPRSAFATADQENGWSELIRRRLPPEGLG